MSDAFKQLKAELEEKDRIQEENLKPKTEGSAAKEESSSEAAPRPSPDVRGRFYLDIQIARVAPGVLTLKGDPIGRVEIETFDDLVPRTAKVDWDFPFLKQNIPIASQLTRCTDALCLELSVPVQG